MTKPNAFILGAPKCGTTTLAAWLADHPQAFFCPTKEPHFFNFDYGPRRFRSLARYEKLFDRAEDRHRAITEASTTYLYSRTAVPAILHYSERPKFIVTIRNPVDMAPSQHSQMLFNGEEDIEDFEHAWRLQDVRAYGDKIPKQCPDPQLLQYGHICRLGTQLARLFECVPAAQILVLRLDAISATPRTEYRRMLDFLGLEDDGRNYFGTHNPAKKRRFPTLLNAIQWSNRAILALGVPQFRLGFTEFMKHTLRRDQPRQPLGKRMRVELEDYFAEDLKLLESVTQFDLSDWRGA